MDETWNMKCKPGVYGCLGGDENGNNAIFEYQYKHE